MKTIKITKEQLAEIYFCLEHNEDTEWNGDFAAAAEYGFGGFIGGFDYCKYRPWSIEIHDRGVFGGGGNFRHNSVRFVVPMKSRKGHGPLADFC